MVSAKRVLRGGDVSRVVPRLHGDRRPASALRPHAASCILGLHADIYNWFCYYYYYLLILRSHAARPLRPARLRLRRLFCRRRGAHGRHLLRQENVQHPHPGRQRDALWDADSCGPRNHVLDEVLILSWEGKVQFGGHLLTEEPAVSASQTRCSTAPTRARKTSRPTCSSATTACQVRSARTELNSSLRTSLWTVPVENTCSELSDLVCCSVCSHLSVSTARDADALCSWAIMYVCDFIRCDRLTSNNKHKNQSQNDVQYKAAKPKTISLGKAI